MAVRAVTLEKVMDRSFEVRVRTGIALLLAGIASLGLGTLQAQTASPQTNAPAQSAPAPPPEKQDQVGSAPGYGGQTTGSPNMMRIAE